MHSCRLAAAALGLLLQLLPRPLRLRLLSAPWAQVCLELLQLLPVLLQASVSSCPHRCKLAGAAAAPAARSTNLRLLFAWAGAPGCLAAVASRAMASPRALHVVDQRAAGVLLLVLVLLGGAGGAVPLCEPLPAAPCICLQLRVCVLCRFTRVVLGECCQRIIVWPSCQLLVLQDCREHNSRLLLLLLYGVECWPAWMSLLHAGMLWSRREAARCAAAAAAAGIVMPGVLVPASTAAWCVLAGSA